MMSDPVSHAERWLQKQGYPLEYEAARLLKKQGYRAWQGLHYRDAESVEPRSREIDVVASERPPKGKGVASVELVVEAKYGHEPWLILTSEILTDRPIVQPHWLLMNGAARDPIEGLLKGAAIPSLLQLAPRHGFNVVQMWEEKNPDRKNPAYVALQSAVKGASARLDVHKRATKMPVLVFPVIVVGGSLVHLGFDDNGARILEPVLWQRVRWQGSTIVDHPVIVDVVQRDHFERWAVEAKKSTAALMELLSEWVTPGALAASRSSRRS